MQLNSGDLVVLYTDGVIEAKNDKGEPFTDEQLKSFVQAHDWKSAQEVIDAISAKAKEFTQSIAQEAEIIVVVLKVN